MDHMYYDPSHDGVLCDKDGWWCIVDDRTFGPWPYQSLAIAGMATEQRRAERRRQKNAEEAA